MDRKQKLIDLLSKVSWEGGWGEMVYYGDPPHINEFPEIKEAWEAFKLAHDNLLAEVGDATRKQGVTLEQYEC